MATFKCLASGNCVSFTQDHDIASMMTHPGYVRVDEVAEIPEKKEESIPVPNRIVMGNIPVVTKRPGRPRKIES
jgi:hypothetical protein